MKKLTDHALTMGTRTRYGESFQPLAWHEDHGITLRDASVAAAVASVAANDDEGHPWDLFFFILSPCNERW